jgi:hypothetical protein
MVNLILFFLSIGILAMPHAFSHAGKKKNAFFFAKSLTQLFCFLGYLVGSVGTVVIGILW